jgi:hypothetical protein
MNPIFIDGSHEYNYESVESKGCTMHNLYYSEAEFWTKPGELVLSLKDTGNEYRIVSKGYDRKKIEHDESIELAIVLKIIFRDRKIEMGESVIKI